MRVVRVTRRYLVTLVCALALAGALSGCSVVKRSAAAPRTATMMPASNATAEQTVLKSVNSLRTSRGLKPLSVHPALVNKARYWALWMAAGNCGRTGGVPRICHSNLAAGITVPWTWLAENVGAASPRSNIKGVIDGLRNSPPHLENILSRRAQYVGVGVAYAGDTVYVVEEFMAQ
jgi:uncharacterized protein YkwD